MAEKRRKEPLPQVQWKEEKRVLTLEKIPVLEMDLSVPQLTGGGRGGERISPHHQRLAGGGRRRWRRDERWAGGRGFGRVPLHNLAGRPHGE